jgi:hypothetical protein
MYLLFHRFLRPFGRIHGVCDVPLYLLLSASICFCLPLSAPVCLFLPLLLSLLFAASLLLSVLLSASRHLFFISLNSLEFGRRLSGVCDMPRR